MAPTSQSGPGAILDDLIETACALDLPMMGTHFWKHDYESHSMNIGQAAEASGVSAKMIRYYESIALIAPASRSEAGYRHYSAAEIHTLRFVRRARDLGFPIATISRLLALWQDRSRASGDVKAIAREQIAALRQKIGEMEAMAATLEHLAHNCHGDARPDCPILDDLATPAKRA